MATQPVPLLTPEQYLEIERAAECKSEYFRGEIFAMAGASAAHDDIAINVIVQLRNQLRGKPCRVHTADMRVLTPHTGLYTYPDATVVCGDRQFADDRLDILLNPILIVEVLSPSTEGYDRGRKFEHYRSIESLRQYLLIAQDRLQVDLFSRQADGHWLLASFTKLEDTVPLDSAGCVLSVADCYEGVAIKASGRD